MKLLHSTLRLCIAAVIFVATAHAQSLAPGAPGKDAQWATAAKQAIGTSATLESKVWFTLAQGVMTEVYYPDVTVANVHVLQFVVVDPKTKKVETERDDAIHQIRALRTDSLSFQQVNKARSGKWVIMKSYVSDPVSNSVLIKVNFQPKVPGLKLYVYFDPSISNTGMHDSGEFFIAKPIDQTQANSKDLISGFISHDANIYSFLTLSAPLVEVSTGFLGTSDGLEQLRKFGEIRERFGKAENGNITQIARVVEPSNFVVTLSFAPSVDEVVKEPFRSWTQYAFKEWTEPPSKSAIKFPAYVERLFTEYDHGWSDYVKTLPKVDPKYQAQFNMAAMVLKAQEDKTVRGANVASLTIPWGGGANANEDVGGGYHLVWARDLYHVFTAYMALGDKAAAERALDFLFNIQQKEDGSFPQNSWLDGKRGWGSLQMDEVGYPLIMAYQLGRFDKATYENHVKRAADFLVRNGPKTPQDRWEERPGYSPSTIAAEIAGLVCAAEIAKRNNDEASSVIYLATADDWARNIERWTATTTGKFGDGNYYLRITQNGRPDAGEKVELNNNAGTFDEREVVDAGFLELVRLGIKPADDPLIAKSVKVIDQQIKVATPNGESFYRYSHDGYGEMDDGRKWNFDGKYTGKGRLWALLAGERGQYELALASGLEAGSPAPSVKQMAGKPASKPSSGFLSSAQRRLDAMLAFANEGLMIPEQIWDKPETPKSYDHEWVPDLKFGEGTGSATPLAWSMGQFIRLATNLKAGRNLDTPDIVYNRYVKAGIPTLTSNFGGSHPDVVLLMKPGETMKFPRQAAPGTKLVYQINGETHLIEADEKGQMTIEFKVPAEETVGIVGVQSPDGSTAFERVTVRSKPKEQTFAPELIDKIKAAKESPLIDGDKVILFYRGTAQQNVQVAGDVTSWNPNQIFMQKIADDLWAAQLDLAPTARTEYKLIVDGKWILDPANPNAIDNGVGDRNNYLTMPAYKPNELAIGEDATLDEFDIQSKNFGTRHIKIYVPDKSSPFGQRTRASDPVSEAGRTSASPKRRDELPVLYLEDGSDYITRAKAVQVQQSLVRAGRVRPFIMVFIDPKDRNKEYWANDRWADFVANEVVPEIDKRYNTTKDRDGRATLGASLGGITSLWIGLRYPDKFSRLGGESSSFWVDDERVVRELAKLDPNQTKFRFYLDDGTFEGPEDTRRVNVMLRGKGYPVTYVEGQTGHNWTAWRDRLAGAFVALWK